jgi:hypothetical protein
MRAAGIVLIAGLLALAAALVLVLSGSPAVLAGTNGIEPAARLAAVPGSGSGCQARETLPAHTTAIRLSLEASSGPRVAIAVRAPAAGTAGAGGTAGSAGAAAAVRAAGTAGAVGPIVARGQSAPGWLAKVVTVPLAPLDRAVRDVTVCFAFRGANERISFLGAPSARRVAASYSAGRPVGSPAGGAAGGLPGSPGGVRALPGRIAIEYLRAGSRSWWSLASSTARRMGLGRAWAGTWVAIAVACLMASAIAAGAWLIVRESR